MRPLREAGVGLATKSQRKDLQWAGKSAGVRGATSPFFP